MILESVAIVENLLDVEMRLIHPAGRKHVTSKQVRVVFEIEVFAFLRNLIIKDLVIQRILTEEPVSILVVVDHRMQSIGTACPRAAQHRRKSSSSIAVERVVAILSQNYFPVVACFDFIGKCSRDVCISRFDERNAKLC